MKKGFLCKIKKENENRNINCINTLAPKIKKKIHLFLKKKNK